MAKVTFSQAERDFLNRNEACRIASCHDGIPHVVPVSYIFEHDSFFIATDYETRKYKNIKDNKTAALVVDIYSSVGNSAVCVQGTDEIIERGKSSQGSIRYFTIALSGSDVTLGVKGKRPLSRSRRQVK